MSAKPEAGLSQNPLMRLLVLSPLLLSGAAATMLTISAPFAWGAADEFGISSWVPTASALVLSIPGLTMAFYGITRVLQRMTGLFEVDMFAGLTGAVAHWMAAVCMVIFTGTMGSAESYESLGAGGTTSAGFFFLCVLAALIGGALLAGLTAAYVWAVTPGRKTRVGERSPDQPDYVDDWARRNRRR